MLKVEGLAEKRPSVVVGDLVDVNALGERRRVFKGDVREVERMEWFEMDRTGWWVWGDGWAWDEWTDANWMG